MATATDRRRRKASLAITAAEEALLALYEDLKLTPSFERTLDETNEIARVARALDTLERIEL